MRLLPISRPVTTPHSTYSKNKREKCCKSWIQSCQPPTLVRDELLRMRELVADVFTVALDAVTPAIFDRTRGKGVDSPRRWEKYWRTLE